MHTVRYNRRVLYVTKADGTSEPFREEKVIASLVRAGASREDASAIAARIIGRMKSGQTTSAIYAAAFAELRKAARPIAARYSLRRALHDLGPTGFPFEDFVGELFRAEGYRVEVRKTLSGACVPHEVDVFATREDRCMIAELKFHNRPGFKTDVKTALYVEARYHDIKSGAGACTIDAHALVTNTKFTDQAIAYGECVGLTLISFSYPRGGSLLDLMDKHRLYPVTALTTLTNAEKARLLESGTVAARTLTERPEVLRSSGIARGKHARVCDEVTALCDGGALP